MADLNHLHLHVKSLARSQRFYESWFGFREHARHGDVLLLRDGKEFDLALFPDPKPARLPEWFHLGFRLPTATDVHAFHARMKSLKSRGKIHTEPGYVSFRLRDPDGHGIEVYWE